MILGESFAISQVDQRSMSGRGGFTEVMALAGTRCEHVGRLGRLYWSITMRLGHSSTHVGVAMSYFLAAVLDLGTRILHIKVTYRGPSMARCELL